MVLLNSSWVLREREIYKEREIPYADGGANETCLTFHVCGTSQHRHLLV